MTNHHISPDELRTDFGAIPGQAEFESYAYWMGVTESCPVNQINCAGLNFPKTQEIDVPHRDQPGERVRMPVFGGLHRNVTADHIERMREMLPRIVIRFTDKPAQTAEPGAEAAPDSDAIAQPRKGHLITIPTEEQIEAGKEVGARKVRPYIPLPGDKQAMDYMYFVPCDDQDKPLRGAVIPKTLAETGITWLGAMQTTTKPKKRRGRPKGAKNKPKPQDQLGENVTKLVEADKAEVATE